MRLHSSEMRGKALSYSLLRRITWPSKRKSSDGVIITRHLFYVGSEFLIIKKKKKGVCKVSNNIQCP